MLRKSEKFRLPAILFVFLYLNIGSFLLKKKKINNNKGKKNLLILNISEQVHSFEHIIFYTITPLFEKKILFCFWKYLIAEKRNRHMKKADLTHYHMVIMVSITITQEITHTFRSKKKDPPAKTE